MVLFLLHPKDLLDCLNSYNCVASFIVSAYPIKAYPNKSKREDIFAWQMQHFLIWINISDLNCGKHLKKTHRLSFHPSLSSFWRFMWPKCTSHAIYLYHLHIFTSTWSWLNIYSVGTSSIKRLFIEYWCQHTTIATLFKKTVYRI